MQQDGEDLNAVLTKRLQAPHQVSMGQPPLPVIIQPQQSVPRPASTPKPALVKMQGLI